MIYMEGKRFGRLLVNERVGTQCGQALWGCTCDCGKTVNVLGQNLRRGSQVSCGCYDQEKKTAHGATKDGKLSPEYGAWKAMKSRCCIKNNTFYHNYGGRGITVCDRWVHSFENFLTDMGHKPTIKHTLDRIDVNGNYEPSNCRWADSTTQMINQRIRKDSTSGYKGISWSKTLNKWHAYISLGHKQKRINIGYFADLEQAIEARKQAETNYHSTPF